MRKGSLTGKLSPGQGYSQKQKQWCLTFSKALHHYGAFSHFSFPQLHLTTAKWGRHRGKKSASKLLEIQGNVSLMRNYTSYKICSCTRLFLGAKLKVEMNASQYEHFEKNLFWCPKKQEGPDLSFKHWMFTMRTEGILFWMFVMKSFFFSFIFCFSSKQD